MYLPVLHYLQFQYCLVLWYYYACDASNQQQSPLAVDSSAASSGLGLLAEDWRRAVGLVLLPVLPLALFAAVGSQLAARANLQRDSSSSSGRRLLAAVRAVAGRCEQIIQAFNSKRKRQE